MKEISQIINGRRVIVKKPELLAPAGNLEKLKVAIRYGADAVFVGGKEFSLRSNASNFSLEDIKEAVTFAKQYHASVHVTCNIILHDDNVEGLEDYLKQLDAYGVKAVIVADPYIMVLCKKLGLKMEVHVSTQMSVINSQAIGFFETLGMDRVVLGREVTYEQLCKIRQATNMDIEYFIHGAMCINYSGRCMLSNHYSRRDANRGGCSQSCRWFYDLHDHDDSLTHDQDYFSMSSKDLCLIAQIPSLIEAGIDSFKIEGRMKSVHYIATVVSTYRKLIDAYCEDPDHFVYTKDVEEELNKAANRWVAEGFYHGVPDEKYQLFNLRDEHPTQEFCLRVLEYDAKNQRALIEQRNYFKVGDKIEVFGPHHQNYYFKIETMYDEDGLIQQVANHPMQKLWIDCPLDIEAEDMGRLVR